MCKNIFKILVINLISFIFFYSHLTLAEKKETEIILLEPGDSRIYDPRFWEKLNILSRPDYKFGIDSYKEVQTGVFELPTNQLEIYLGENKDTLERMNLKGQNPETVKLIVPNDRNIDVYQQMINLYGSPSESISSQILQGKASFKLQNGSGGASADSNSSFILKAEAFFLQPKGTEMGLITSRINTFAGGRDSIDNSDAFSKILHHLPTPLLLQYKEVGVISLAGTPFTAPPQHWANYWEEQRYGYTYLIREIPAEAKNLPEEKILVPLHGLLSTTGLDLMVKLSGKVDSNAWIETEYLPKFVKMLAHINFNMGFWVEPHTQNFSVILNLKNGIIEKFLLKDFQDLMSAPYLQGIQNIYKYNTNTGPGILNSNWINPYEPDIMKYAGMNFMNYTADSIIGITKDEKISKKLMGKFLELYLQEAESLLGRSSLTLISEKYKKMLMHLQKGEEIELIESRFINMNLTGLNQIENLYILAAEFIQDITDTFAIIKFRNLLSEMQFKPITKDQAKTLKSIFTEKASKREVSWATMATEKEYNNLNGSGGWFKQSAIEYLPLSTGVLIAYNRETNNPLGMAYNLSVAQFNAVESIFRSIEFESKITILSCENLF